MGSLKNYITGFGTGLWSLLIGMKVTIINLFRPKVTQQYPENRDTLVMFDRFRGELVMPHNANNEHKCTGCGICQTNCPNGTIIIKTKTETTEEGKSKKALDTYIYDLGKCTFCNLCVITCPSKAIEFSTKFENSVFTREKLVRTLNQEGSTLEKK